MSHNLLPLSVIVLVPCLPMILPLSMLSLPTLVFCVSYLHYARPNAQVVHQRDFDDWTETFIRDAHSHRLLSNVGGCTERRNVFFLKIAKAGSTTVQQLLLRFGLVRDLSFMLFVNKWSYPSPTFSQFLLPEPNRSTGFDGRYNILCEHTVFNEPEVKRLMPSDTFYVAIFRHPLTHIKSYINYVNMYKKLNISSSKHFLSELLRDPVRHDKKNSTRNKMATFFGLPRGVNDQAAGDALIRLIDEKFDLVLIMERIDESLVLMKRRLCWSTKDILYLPLRVENYKGKTNGKEENKEHLIVRHRKWSTIDYAMYDHFERKLQAQIVVEKNLDDEVTTFRQVRNRTVNFCSGLRDLLCKKPHNTRILLRVQDYLNSTIQFDRTPYDEPFSVTGLDCFLMMLHNDIYRRALTVKQLPEVCDLVASKPDRFRRKPDQKIMPHEIGRDGTLPFTIYSSFCRDIFAYTLPRFLVTGSPLITWQ
ncbi:Galactose-3-O-sulfotransferase 2 [Lamellibrachia satsuma]|nr:Galactose-3-O-sulfotransferase 2 [Lamellibrachia satsuma]